MNKLSSIEKNKLIPQEEVLELKSGKLDLFIGLPKEKTFQENRIAIVPEAVHLLVSNGHTVLIESGYGDNANFSDHEFSEAGAKVIYDTKEIYQADIIMKVEPPTIEEVDMMKGRQILISALQITTQNQEYINKLLSKKNNCFGF